MNNINEKELLDIVTEVSEVNEDSLKELSNGKGDDNEQQ